MLKRKEFIVGAAAGLLIAAGATAGGALTWPGADAQSRADVVDPRGVVRASNNVVFSPPPGAPLSFADIVDTVSPAVVSIDVAGRAPSRQLNIPGFGVVPVPPGAGGEEGADPNAEPQQYGSGSGFFISADGYVVTNNHVIAGAEEITVRLNDERSFPARVVGRDEGTDLAVLKVDGQNLPFVTFETDARPRVGDWVIAVGNPLGLGGTVTAGIVSAYGRQLQENYVDYIQIDAPINRGNSGGPTFDIYGRVIGVNSAIYSPSGYSVGIGFAIPADVANRVTRQLIENGRVERGYLGVTVGVVTEDTQRALGLPNTEGALVVEVTPGGPADRAGVQASDVVVSLNGEAIEDSVELTRRVGDARPGDNLRLEVLRGGRRMTLNARSASRPEESVLNGGDQAQPGQGPRDEAPATPQGASILGLQVAPLTPQLREQYGIDAGARGLVVLAVEANSDAGRKGFRPGMVITRADTVALDSVAAFRDVVARVRQAGRPGVFLLVNVGGRQRPVVVDLD
ncbi:Do family serine endopeptidase [Brevundimonas sp. 2R-24]|uniref:Do family serine endopeptidase n=1 Tax=Peiella sedimenti TaxID=3061083 RepID=A0ABT8SHT4_9CAUL|nr:Do family serine endopeptidase [Caulobacteraceae bacterium XZ-24]